MAEAPEIDVRKFVDALPAITIFVSNDEHYTVKFANAEAGKMLGYTTEDFINNRRYSAYSVVHPDDLDVVDRQAELVATTGGARIARYRLVAVDGGFVPVLDVSRPWIDHGSALGFITVILDLRLAPELTGPSKVFEQ
ncbi:MAG: PAS domain-containing protein [Planctomycetes bacterium]|nr:PAS domain-containing protein [Planctomycetota bacterium]MCW8134103.1 PAS domain-containing protein [Planctomycetota bacterium]